MHWILLLAVGASVPGWLLLTAVLARRELERVAVDAALVRDRISAGQLPAARTVMVDVRTHADRAHRLVSGPVWSVAAKLPIAGSAVRSLHGIATVADDLARDGLGPLVESAADVDIDRIRRPDGRVDLDRLAAVAPAVHRAAAAFDRAERTVGALPARSGIAAIDRARARLSAALGQLARACAQLDRISPLLPAMLGHGGDRTYLLVFQNEAEARGTGGLPGAFALGRAVDGRITFTHLDSERVLVDVPANVDLGPEYDQLYASADATRLYGNANLSPHFPYAAQIWASMWQQKFSQHLDGVIAVDPTVLGYLLRAAGPARLPDGTSIDADDVVRLTERDAYAKFPGLDLRQDTARRKFLTEIEQAVVEHIADTRGDGLAMVEALRAAATQRRLLVWSAHPAEEAQLISTDLGGAVPVTTAPYVGLSIVNDGGNKLDYYLDRALRWERSGCAARRTARVTITLTNNAPARGLPALVTSRSDAHPYPVAPGDNRLIVSYLATSGAVLDSARLDGTPLMVGSGESLGHPVLNVDVELPRGATRRIELVFTEPASASAAPVVLRQPLVRPLSVELVDRPCSDHG